MDELEACQEARKSGYVGAIPKEDTVFLEVSQGNIRKGISRLGTRNTVEPQEAGPVYGVRLVKETRISQGE